MEEADRRLSRRAPPDLRRRGHAVPEGLTAITPNWCNWPTWRRSRWPAPAHPPTQQTRWAPICSPATQSPPRAVSAQTAAVRELLAHPSSGGQTAARRCLRTSSTRFLLRRAGPPACGTTDRRGDDDGDRVRRGRGDGLRSRFTQLPPRQRAGRHRVEQRRGRRCARHAQTETQQGPCIDAIRTGEVMVVDDLTDDRRYTSYGPRAVEATGVRSSLGAPLNDGHRTIGALNLFSDQPRTFAESRPRKP